MADVVRQGYTSPVRGGYPALIGPAWLAHHLSVARQQLTGQVKVTLPSTRGAYSELTHSSPEIPGATLYEGGGRLVQIGNDSTQPVGGQQIETRRYRLTIDRDAALIPAGAVAKFTSVLSPVKTPPIGPAVPLVSWLVGRPLTVVAPIHVTLEWQHDLIVEDNLG